MKQTGRIQQDVVTPFGTQIELSFLLLQEIVILREAEGHPLTSLIHLEEQDRLLEPFSIGVFGKCRYRWHFSIEAYARSDGGIELAGSSCKCPSCRVAHCCDVLQVESLRQWGIRRPADVQFFHLV